MERCYHPQGGGFLSVMDWDADYVCLGGANYGF